ncbi:MAG: phosphatidylserine/phosphatidylglycerophosphate/cardiolipin synthase family protein [Sulfuricurvum sp.]|nr:phosphatidylserine/phosphatidylglycerophosphate/cardiolipin synthase family protein [Sulfuricurvum sp.]
MENIQVTANKYIAASTSTPWHIAESEYPIQLCSNNIELLVCGEEAFGAVEKAIQNAKKSIDIISWGFDPAMSFSGRGGERIGDLLIQKASQADSQIEVRLLIWHSITGNLSQNNLPGVGIDFLKPHDPGGTDEDSAFREKWYDDIKSVANLYFRTRDMTICQLGKGLVQSAAFSLARSHHQKMVLVDYELADPTISIGFVMGHNSLMEYWDDQNHNDESTKRFDSCKPWQDLSTKVAGMILYDMNQNFVSAWDNKDKSGVNFGTVRYKQDDNDDNLTAKREHITALDFLDLTYIHTAQILRTQPQHGVTDIYKTYKLACQQAHYYLYFENQYFRHEELANHLIKVQKEVKSKGRTSFFNVFVVTNPPQSTGEALSTYEMVKALGHPNTMPKYVEEDNAIKEKDSSDKPSNEKDKQLIEQLEKDANMRVLIATLMTPKGTPIYVHSKLLLVDDSFFLLGSANINRRSMEIDSELAVCTAYHTLASTARKKLMSMHYNGDNGESGLQNEPACSIAGMDEIFENWQPRMQTNLKIWKVNEAKREEAEKNGKTFIPENTLTGHLVEFYYDDYGRTRTD